MQLVQLRSITAPWRLRFKGAETSERRVSDENAIALLDCCPSVGVDCEYEAMSTLPKPALYVAVKSAVMKGAVHIAQACSFTMARRIAKLLNEHPPGKRGY